MIAFLGGAPSAARADICVAIDTSRDTLTSTEQAAAQLLLIRQFELAGEQVVPSGCAATYLVSHVRLGNIIVVTVTGPTEREATAQGMDDLPALYSQMVRSIVSGRPMTASGIVDRTNVTAAQASARRVHTDSLWYGRLGYGSMFGDRAYGTPALGFGYRAEFNTLGFDVSFLNLQIDAQDTFAGGDASAHSILKLSGLYFLNPTSNNTAYVGGGLSYGRQHFGGGTDASTNVYTTRWTGSGLQAEVTAGYELARATSVRMFVQVDATFPFYQAVAETYSIPRFGLPMTVLTSRRYAPSLVVSLGLGR
jgi:hypothetical protein